MNLFTDKYKKLQSNRSGVSLIEAIFTIVLVIIILAIFSSSFTNIRLVRKNNNNALAYDFIQSQMEAIRTYPYASLTNQVDGDFVGFAYNHGNQSIEPFSIPPSPPNVLTVFPAAVSLANNISSIALLEKGFLEDFTFQFDVNVDPSSETNWETGMLLRYQDPENYYFVVLNKNTFGFVKMVGGISSMLFSDNTPRQEDVWYSVRVIANLGTFEMYLNNSLVATVIDSDFQNGFVGLMGAGNTRYYVDDMVLNTASFNNIWNFDSEDVGGWPDGFVMNAPVGLNDYEAKLTIEDYNGISGIKQITAAVEWRERGELKSANLNTLRTAPYEP